jgi:hypothetical protein
MCGMIWVELRYSEDGDGLWDSYRTVELPEEVESNYLKNLKTITWSIVRQLPEEYRSNYLKNLKAITWRIEKQLPEAVKSE